MRPLTALTALVLVLTACAPAAPAVPTHTPQPSETLRPSPTATQTPSPTPTITPTPTPMGGGSGKLIFEYDRASFEKSFPDLKGEMNVFTSNVDGTDLTPVTNGLLGLNRIESISPDGRMLLVSSSSVWATKGDLYLFHLDSPASDPVKLARGLIGSRQAIFLDNSRILYIGQGRQNYGFYLTDTSGTEPMKIGAPTGRFWNILSSDQTRVYWESDQKMSFSDSYGGLYFFGDFTVVYWTNLDGSGQGKLASNGRQIIGGYAFSADGKTLAWIPVQTEPGCIFSSFLTRWIMDGTYTDWAALPAAKAAKHGIPKAWLGQTIDMTWVKDYARRCWILYVAPTSDLDHPTKITLLPSDSLIQGDFTFSGYWFRLSWTPDGSTLFLYNDGTNAFVGLYEEPLLYCIHPTEPEAQLAECKHALFSSTDAQKISVLGASPDGQQILIGNRATGPYIRIFDLKTMAYNYTLGKNLTPDFNVPSVENIYWLP